MSGCSQLITGLSLSKSKGTLGDKNERESYCAKSLTTTYNSFIPNPWNAKAGFGLTDG